MAHAVLMLVVFIIEIMLIAFILTLDILPGKYFVALLAGILAIDAVIIWLINDEGKKSKKRLIGAILCGVMIVCSCIGTYFVYDTYKTMEIISAKMNQTITYDVVVLNDSVYEDLDDIEGQTVYSVLSGKDTYNKAKTELESSVDVNFEETTGCMDAGEKLVSLSGAKQDNILFISDPEYDMTDDIIEGFKKETKVIHKITVKLPFESSDNIDVLHDPFNVLISGIDTRGEISDVARSDVNMIVTVNPNTHTILLTSMPRDSYVPLHMNGEMDKLTHSGIYGIDETIMTIEDWLNIDINYYARVNFKMLVKLVDAVGGIDVYNDIDFYSSVKGWHFKKGWHHMHGTYALWYLRERKAFKDEDEQRIKNQQKVMKALLEKCTSKKTLVANYTEILEAVGEDMQTSMSQKEISELAKMQLDDMPEWTIKRQCIDGDDAELGTWSMGMNRPLFVSVPKEKSVKKVSRNIKKVMNPEED